MADGARLRGPAALIGIATLSSGAQREAVLAENRLPAYRDEAVGCVVQRSGESATTVRARFDDFSASYPLPDPGDPRFFDAVEERSAFDALLQTNRSSLVSTLVPT